MFHFIKQNFTVFDKEKHKFWVIFKPHLKNTYLVQHTVFFQSPLIVIKSPRVKNINLSIW